LVIQVEAIEQPILHAAVLTHHVDAPLVDRVPSTIGHSTKIAIGFFNRIGQAQTVGSAKHPS
jgi:hypothetical protein